MIQSRCGLKCEECSFKLSGKCEGCTKIENPFWGVCSIKGCCESKNLAHCGQCTQFPCLELTVFSWDEANGDEGKRIDTCRDWLDEE